MRLVVRNHRDEPLFELLAPGDTESVVRTDEVNGVHSLEVRTTRLLEKGNRILYKDGMGKWREYVVVGVSQSRDSAGVPVGEYYCVWSLQADLEGTQVNRIIGYEAPVRAEVALDYALEGTTRWSRGTVEVSKSAFGSMYYRNGYEALSVVTERWGGEVEAELQVDESAGTVSRRVNLRAKVGNQSATRRFDYSHDMKGITREVSDRPVTPRVLPVGASLPTEDGGYTRRIHIGEVNDGIDWLQDDTMADVLKVPDGNGGWEYPCQQIENIDLDDPQALKDWALEHISEYSHPLVTYSAEVVNFAEAGLDPHGIAEGDLVHVVDREFYEDGIALDARVVKLVVNELDPTDQEITIGNMGEGFASAFKALSAGMERALDMSGAANSELGRMSTTQYVSELIARMNAEANATGGYTYIVEGEGVLTYDRPVTDPPKGTGATQVVQIKGGNIRIANSRTSSGDWDWKTVLQSGHIAADLVTAAKITTGYIGSVGSDFWLLGENGHLETYESVFNSSTITNAAISSGTITNAAISSGTITSANISKGLIESATIDKATITSSSMTNASVSGSMTSGSGKYSTELKNATLRGFYDGTESGFVNFSTTYVDPSSGQVTGHGMKLFSPYIMSIITPQLAVESSSSSSGSGLQVTANYKFRQQVVTDIALNGDGTVAWVKKGTFELDFVHGMLVDSTTVQ